MHKNNRCAGYDFSNYTFSLATPTLLHADFDEALESGTDCQERWQA